MLQNASTLKFSESSELTSRTCAGIIINRKRSGINPTEDQRPQLVLQPHLCHEGGEVQIKIEWVSLDC